ncbi:MAG: type II toxin-antitoxin system Phd/YefM family antitoxin [Chloroflexota bacterium]
MATALGTAEIKARLSEIINRVAFGRERLIVLRRGKPVAALVSVNDLRQLEALDSTDPDNDPGVHPIMRVFGGWADRADLDELLAEIYAARESATGREVTL